MHTHRNIYFCPVLLNGVVPAATDKLTKIYSNARQSATAAAYANAMYASTFATAVADCLELLNGVVSM